MIQFLGITLVTFILMEAFAYFAHRYLFHGPLWFLHKSHHEPRKGSFEWNDLFGLFFVPIAMVLMGGWLAPEWRHITFPIGTGMTLYGAVYLFLHDIFTHRRMVSVNSKNSWLLEMRSAHRRHHSCVKKEGQEPFGFVHFRTYPEAKKVAKRLMPLGVFALMAFGTGCNTVVESLVEKPKVALEKVSIRDANSRGATALFNISVDNPNPFGVKVDSIRYDIELGGKKFTSGVVEKGVQVSAKEKSVVEIPIDFKYNDLFTSLVDALQKKSSSYRIKGDAAFGLISIPFDESGELKLK